MPKRMHCFAMAQSPLATYLRAGVAKAIVQRAVVPSLLCAFAAFTLQVATSLGANAQRRPIPLVKQSDYMLGPQDQLRLRILEWRAGAGEYKEWTALNGDYKVSAAGNIVVPLIGSLRAANTTTRALSAVIAKRLKERVRLSQLPDVTIEIATHRPVYVVGEVQQPGEFPYRPGLTALRLVAIAGGIYRDPQNGQAAQTGKISAERALAQARIDLRRAYVRRSRLTAELALVESLDFTTVTFSRPAELTDGDDVDKLLLNEQQILTARIKGFSSKHSAFKALLKLLRQEGESLQKKIGTLKKQIQVAEKRNARTQALWKKRFISATGRLNIERDLSQLQSQMLDHLTTALRVKQDISKADRGAENARSDYMALITTELQEIDATIDRLKGAIKKEQQLLRIAIAGLPARSKLAEKTMDSVLFSIRRAGRAGAPEDVMEADATTPVKPGDVVIVSVPVDVTEDGSVGAVRISSPTKQKTDSAVGTTISTLPNKRLVR